MMHRTTLAAILAVTAAIAAGCGSGSSSCSTGQRHARAGECVPASEVHAPPETARLPEGYTRAAPPKPGLRLYSQEPKHVSEHGLRVIEGFEEVQKSTYCPYWDAYGSVWTRGFGETDWGGNFGGRCISNAQATANLKYQLESQYEWAIRGMGVFFNQNQWDALASFAWNLGAGIFTGSLRYSLQHHNPYPMLAYDRAGGQVLSGLASRRRAEVALFLTPAREETAAERHARKVRELRSAERELGTYRPPTGIRGRINALRHALLSHRCVARRKHHKHLGPTCRRWFREGDAAHARGLHLLGVIVQLHREGIR